MAAKPHYVVRLRSPWLDRAWMEPAVGIAELPWTSLDKGMTGMARQSTRTSQTGSGSGHAPPRFQGVSRLGCGQRAGNGRSIGTNPAAWRRQVMHRQPEQASRNCASVAASKVSVVQGHGAGPDIPHTNPPPHRAQVSGRWPAVTLRTTPCAARAGYSFAPCPSHCAVNRRRRTGVWGF